MSEWKNIIKADNVDFYPKDEDPAWYDTDTKETTLNLSSIQGLENLLDSDLHETIHKVTYDEIKEEIRKVVDEETKFLINRPDLYRIEGKKVQPKRQLFEEVLRKRKIANYIAFTEIVTIIQDRTRVNLDANVDIDDLAISENRMSIYGYMKQFAIEMRDAYYPMWINIMRGALNALGLDPNVDKPGFIYRNFVTERSVKRTRKLRDDFYKSVGALAAQILIEIIEKNEPTFPPTIDYTKKPESYTDAKERIKRSKEESPEDRAKRIKDKVAGRKMKKSWEGVLKNIQISGQKTSSKDYVKPDDDTECCELLAEIIKEATGFENPNRFGDGMVGDPTFYSTQGYTPDDDFFDMISEWRQNYGDENFYDDIITQLSKTGDAIKEWERLKNLWEEASKYGLNYKDSCQNIVTNLDKWADRNFVGWKFYEDWVYPYTSSLSTPAKNLVDKDYERYMDSYRKVWIALLQNDCADILIQKPWMRMANQG